MIFEADQAIVRGNSLNVGIEIGNDVRDDNVYLELTEFDNDEDGAGTLLTPEQALRVANILIQAVIERQKQS